jgi:hypothetical protein
MNEKQAAEQWSEFHWGDNPREIVRAELYVPSKGEHLVVLGKLRRVDYQTCKAREQAIWFHNFSRPFPWLCASGDGSLHIVGGRYTVQARGIVG